MDALETASAEDIAPCTHTDDDAHACAPHDIESDLRAIDASLTAKLKLLEAVEERLSSAHTAADALRHKQAHLDRLIVRSEADLSATMVRWSNIADAPSCGPSRGTSRTAKVSTSAPTASSGATRWSRSDSAGVQRA